MSDEGRASLVVQGLRVCLPMQGTQVQSLVWSIAPATEQVSLWAAASEAHRPRARAPQHEKPLRQEACQQPLKSTPAHHD